MAADSKVHGVWCQERKEQVVRSCSCVSDSQKRGGYIQRQVEFGFDFNVMHRSRRHALYMAYVLVEGCLRLVNGWLRVAQGLKCPLQTERCSWRWRGSSPAASPCSPPLRAAAAARARRGRTGELHACTDRGATSFAFIQRLMT